MPDRAALLAEAYRRNLLPPAQKAAYEEAQRRGLVSPPARNGLLGRTAPAAPATGTPQQRGAAILDRIAPAPRDPLRGDSYTATRQANADARARGGASAAGVEASGALSNFVSGIPFAQDVAAGVGTIIDPRVYRGQMNVLESYRSNREVLRGDTEDFSQRRPLAAMTAQTTGMGASMLIPGGSAANALTKAPEGASFGARAANMGVNALRSAVAAGSTGALYGLGADGTVENRLNNATRGAFTGLAVGAATPLALSAFETRRQVPARTPAPTLEELETAKNAAYNTVDNLGVQYKPEAIDELVTGIRDEARAANISAARHPKAYSMLQDIEALRGQPQSLTQLDQLRQVIRRDVANAPDDAERFFGQKMIAGLDEFIGASTPSQVTAGDAVAGTQALLNARDLNTRVAKINTVNDAVESASLRAGSTGSGGNVDNATRQNLRRVLENGRNLSTEERQALTAIVRGSRTQNVLRTVGKLAPTNPLLGVTGSIVGGLAGGPGGSVAVPATGMLAKGIADAITRQKVTQLVNLMARGGPVALKAEGELAALAANDPAVQQVYQTVAERLTRGVVAASANGTSGR